MQLYKKYIPIYILIYSLTTIPSIYSMEDFTDIIPTDQEHVLLSHESPSRPTREAENPFDHAITTAHGGRENIQLCSQEAGILRNYTLAPTAARHAKILKTTAGTRHIIQDWPDAYVCFIVKLLNHLDLVSQTDDSEEEKNRHIIEFIMMRTEHFTTISLKTTLQLIIFFDIAEALHAMAFLRKPLPFPTTIEEEKIYNNQLLYIFTLRHLENGNFLELFGSMIYQRYISYPKYLRMIRFYYFYKRRQQNTLPQTLRQQSHTFELIDSIHQSSQEKFI